MTDTNKPVPGWICITLWITLGFSMILFNKALLSTWNFGFPFFLTCWHCVFATVLTQVMYKCLPSFFPGKLFIYWNYLFSSLIELSKKKIWFCLLDVKESKAVKLRGTYFWGKYFPCPYSLPVVWRLEILRINICRSRTFKCWNQWTRYLYFYCSF